jgi:hypothetical protein
MRRAGERKRIVAAAIDDFSRASLEEASTAGQTTPDVLLVRAIRYYLSERDSGRPGWPYAQLGEEDEVAEGPSVVELEIDGSAWAGFSREADRQEVSTDRLLQHAALYYLADRDSGRLTQRILDDLEKPES